MDSAEREILSLLGGVSTVFSLLVAIAVLMLGIVVVRPLHKLAGIVFAVAGAGRLVGLGLDLLLDAARPKDAELNTIMIFSALGTLLWIVTALVFYGGIMFGSIKLAEKAPAQRGAW